MPELWHSQIWEEENQQVSAVGRLARARQEEWDESNGIFFDEDDPLRTVRDKKIGSAKAAYATAAAGYTSAYAACMAVSPPTVVLVAKSVKGVG